MNELAEKQLYKYRKILDHGYVALVDYMGSDESIVQAARVSYGQGTKAVSDDETLIRYLSRHKHTTPTEMCVLKFNIAMPIHVHRQHIRHRMSTTNEYSTRYSEVPNVCYEKYDFTEQSSNNKQGRNDNIIEYNEEFHDDVLNVHGSAFNLYRDLINSDVAKEVARMHLPLNTYTYFYWKVDLHNLFHYLTLRCDSHAQYEIRQYANCMAAIVKEVYPIAFRAWYDNNYYAVTFTRLDRILLNKYLELISMEPNDLYNTQIEIYAKELGMTKREISEFWSKIEPPTEQDFSLQIFELIEKKE